MTSCLWQWSMDLWNLSMLISCYGIHSNVKKFAKSIITTTANVRYDNVNQTTLLLEKYAD